MVEVLELIENVHFTVDRDANLYTCNFCGKVVTMAVHMASRSSIFGHLKYAHPDKIKKTKI